MSNTSQRHRQSFKQRIRRVRAVVSGTAERPRMSVFIGGRSNSVQLIDDTTGTTLACATDKTFTGKRGTVEGATFVGETIAKTAAEKKIKQVVFDRRGRRYHGRVQAIAEAARENGLTI